MSKDKPHHEPKKPKKPKAVAPPSVRMPAPMPLSISRPELHPRARGHDRQGDD